MEERFVEWLTQRLELVEPRECDPGSFAVHLLDFGSARPFWLGLVELILLFPFPGVFPPSFSQNQLVGIQLRLLRLFRLLLAFVQVLVQPSRVSFALSPAVLLRYDAPAILVSGLQAFTSIAQRLPLPSHVALQLQLRHACAHCVLSHFLCPVLKRKFS